MQMTPTVVVVYYYLLLISLGTATPLEEVWQLKVSSGVFHLFIRSLFECYLDLMKT